MPALLNPASVIPLMLETSIVRVLHLAADQGICGLHRHLTTVLHSGSQALKRFHGSVPVNAAIRYALTISQGLPGDQVLAPPYQVAFYHYSKYALLARFHLLSNVLEHHRLVLIVFIAIGMTGIDH